MEYPASFAGCRPLLKTLNTDQFLSGSKMENYGDQCAKTIRVRNVSFILRPRRPCDMRGTTNVFFTTIHGLDHALMQLLETFQLV